MTKQEFEQIANRTVTAEQYKAIEALYMASDLDKYDFVKSIKGMLKTIPEEISSKRILVGVAVMPNGTWMSYEAEIVNVNIATGKIEVKRLSPNRCWAETWMDIPKSRVEEIA